MNVVVNYKSGVAFDVETRGHHLICDQPESNGGHDQGMTPPELLLASLGSCAAYYAVEYLKTRKLPLEVRVEVDAEKAMQPARIGKIRLDLHTADLESRHREGLMRAVHACLVQNTLSHSPEIEYRLHTTHDSESLVTQMH